MFALRLHAKIHISAVPVVLAVVAVMTALPGCSTKHYKESADRQVQKILKEKHKLLFGEEEIYEIEQIARDPMADLPRAEKPPLDVPENLKRSEEPPLIISLEKSLEIATYNSRRHQSNKEDVYLAALALTSERHEFSSRFSGIISSSYKRTTTGDVSEDTLTTETGFSVSKLLKDGASIGIDVSTEFLRYLTSDPARAAASILAVKIIQPFWKNAGREVVQENLRQSERDVIYAIRSFARYKKTLTVEVASSYYRVLQQRDVVRNEWNNYQNLIRARDRTENLAKAGRLPEFQVDQARQDELRSRDRWVRSIQTYYQRLDNFKIMLGLPTDANVDLDDTDLKKLAQAGIRQPALSAEEAITMAMEHRLDLMNARGSVEDAERKVKVAENGLGGGVNLVFESSVPTRPERRFAEFRFDQATWNAGLDIDLPLDRLNERNTYRTTLISLARTVREFSLAVDNVKLDVRDAWRRLQQAKESYDIQKKSVELARRRVDSTTTLIDAGRASTRDLLEAQSALLEAQNALTTALVDHTIARLEFYRDIGILRVDKKGLWQEDQNANENAGTDKPRENDRQD